MSYRRSSNSHPDRYHHHVAVRHSETVVTDGADRQYIHMNSHPPKRLDDQYSGRYTYPILDPPQVRNPDLMMMVTNAMEYNNWEQPYYCPNRQDRVTSFERRSSPSFEEEVVDAEADDFIKFEHRKFEQESRMR